MRVEVHLLTHDAEPMLAWSLKHYGTFAQKIVVHDGGPEGLSHDVAVAYGASEVRKWDTNGQLNDEMARHLKNTCWAGTDADWVIVADADELIYFPGDRYPGETLGEYERLGAAMIRPHGFEMFTETVPTGPGQIYDQVKDGAPDDKWYGKPILFSPKRVRESGFGVGAHQAAPLFSNGRRYQVDQEWPQASPATYLLHFRHIGPIELIAGRYDAQRKRLSRVNEVNLWGNFKPGLEHAQEKRDYIIPRLRRIILTQ